MANKDSFDAFVSIIRDKIDELSEHTDQSRIQVFQNELKQKFDDLARSQGYVSSKEYDALENLAARLETNSESNKILISEDTYLLVKEEIKCIKKQEISVKGVSYPIQTYEVSGFTSSSSSYSSKLVKSIPGLSLTFDPNEIEDNERAMKLISDVLSRLV